MRNPNGYGSVVKLSGNRRRPFMARKTVGFDNKGYPIYKAVGYAATREEAMILLAEYNRNPYDLDARKITVAEVYNRWVDNRAGKLTPSTVRGLKSAWKHCKTIYNVKYCELKAHQMQDCIDDCVYGYATKGTIKNLFHHLDRYALELDIIAKCNSDLVKAPPIPDSTKVPFTEDEISALWAIKNQEWVDSILVLIYMGWRISEFLNIKTTDVNFATGVITGGTKTKSGKNRIVPIHPLILPFIKERCREGNEYVFSYKGKRCAENTYYKIWSKIMEQLHIKHTPHECRHTFRSRLDSAGANTVCMNLLMGHKSKEVGERVYTHKIVDELIDTINLLR